MANFNWGAKSLCNAQDYQQMMCQEVLNELLGMVSKAENSVKGDGGLKD